MPSADRIVEAQKHLEAFWGVSQSNGGIEAFNQCRASIEKMKLSGPELRELRLRMPFAETKGIVHGRIQQLRAMLEELGK